MKYFLFLCNQGAISYKDFFKSFKENKLKMGVNTNISTKFQVPDYYDSDDIVDNKKHIKVSAISWFTNLQHNSVKKIELSKTYYGNESYYPKYDNYDAINVNKIKDIPIDYDGVIGVPITFLHYHPCGFEIIGLAAAGYNKEIVGLDLILKGDARPLINKKNTYARIFIKRIK